jgi:stage II sporulation protein P
MVWEGYECVESVRTLVGATNPREASPGSIRGDLAMLHNGTIHDYPNYKSSYANSLSTVKKYLKSYPSLRILLDIHRDGLGAGNPKLRVNTKINGKNAAQIMFVVGTNGTGLEHPNWRENLKLALKLQEKLNSKYPGLAKPIYISKNRYNQHETNGALIIEIGGDGNLLSECLESTKYLAEVIGEIAK